MIAAKWKLWLIGGLAMALMGAMWQWRSEIRNAAQWAVGFDQLEQAIEQQQARIEREEARRADEQRLREDVREELRALRESQRAMQREFRELEHTDEEVADWADQRLPGALVPGRLRRQSADGGDGD